MDIDVPEPLAEDRKAGVVDLAGADSRVAGGGYLHFGCQRNSGNDIALAQRKTDERDLEIAQPRSRWLRPWGEWS